MPTSPKLSKQMVIKISLELDDLITQAFSQHLKDTGEYLSRSDYIRRMLEFSISFSKDDVLLIYNLLDSTAHQEKLFGNESRFEVLRDKANKCKELYDSMTKSEQ
jgi:Arc/MetJ-type ribon-helix-helix transcriptional regulator